MPGCCAKNCRNRAEQGFRLFRFPSDKLRKQMWVDQSGINPKECSRLCEYHFDHSQFENRRQDGWRKLKPNAVPTIFEHNKNTAGVLLKNQIHQTNSTINSVDEDLIDDINDEHGYCQTLPAFIEIDLLSDDNFNNQSLPSDYNGSRQSMEINHLRKQLAYVRERNHILTSKLLKEKRLRLKAAKHNVAYKNMRNKYVSLIKRLEEMPLLKHFASGIINPRTKWSPESLQLANRIRTAVGWKTYLYLTKDLGLPLPSYSTLCRHIAKEFSPDALPDVMNLIDQNGTCDHADQSDYVLSIDENEMVMNEDLKYDINTDESKVLLV